MSKRVIYRWALFFTYVTAVFLLMLITFNPSEVDIPGYLFGIEIDKLVHFAIFLPYTALAWFAFSLKDDSFKRQMLFLVTLFFSGVTLASITETAQLLNPARNGDIRDLAADIISVATGTLFIFVYLILKNKFCKKGY